jgi:hypothetical protein
MHRLYQSNLTKPSSTKEYRQNWVEVIEEYKKDKEQLARDLGIPEPTARMRKTTIQTQKEPSITKGDIIESLVWDIFLGGLFIGGSFCYYTFTGKEKPSRAKVLADQRPDVKEGEDVEIWLTDADMEGKWKEQEG